MEKESHRIVEITEIDIPFVRSRFLLDEDNEAESYVSQHGFEPDRYEIVLEKNKGRYQVISGAGVLRGIQRLQAKGFSAPSELEATIRKRSLFQSLIAKTEKHPKRYLVTSALLLLFLVFYWFQLRPAQIRQSCGNYYGDSYSRCLHRKGLDR